MIQILEYPAQLLDLNRIKTLMGTGRDENVSRNIEEVLINKSLQRCAKIITNNGHAIYY